jgi:hypothetical protein
MRHQTGSFKQGHSNRVIKQGHQTGSSNRVIKQGHQTGSSNRVRLEYGHIGRHLGNYALMPRKIRVQYPGAIYPVLRLNRRRALVGHVFSGRYKALLVDGSRIGYLKCVCDDVHLNPARAGLLQPDERLLSYPWSCLRWYLTTRAHRPSWIAPQRRRQSRTHHRRRTAPVGWTEPDLGCDAKATQLSWPSRAVYEPKRYYP